jgi:hypothetical protein
MARIFPQIKSLVNENAFFVLLILLLFLTLILESQLHIIYAGNNSIFSGNQINPNATHINIGTNDSTLQITTDKQRYVLGEKVMVTIKNNWKFPLEFPDSLLGLNIENVKTGQRAGLLAAQVISELKPNESKTFQWDQKDTDANQAEPGIYKAKSSSMTSNPHNTQPITANTTFSINRNP